MSSPKSKARPRPVVVDDPTHHLTGPFQPQTPLGSAASSRTSSPSPAFKAFSHTPPTSPLIRWVTEPLLAFKLLLIPIILYINWDILAPLIDPALREKNPFAPTFLLSHLIPTSSPLDPRYQKGYLDLVFVAYHVIFWSCIRQIVTINLCRRVARYFGIKKEAKLDRFGEQGYALVYFGFFAIWGLRIMSQLPTWWYNTKYYWIGYPHWDMKPELKRYYLMQMAYWFQQLIVLLLKLEKPRKDYNELVAHHFVTLWLVGWSYLVNLTLIGHSVYLSMDLPDTLLALSKLLNYIQWEMSKYIVFAILLVAWSYFRLWLNVDILRSVWTEFKLIPSESMQWNPESGAWLVWWMKYQIFAPLVLLLLLNIFWWFLIVRIAYRALKTHQATDDRSDDEDDGDDNDKEE